MSGPLLIYGAGGHGLVVAEAARAAGFEVLGFIDDEQPPGTEVGSLAVLGGGGMAVEYDAQIIVAIGDNRRRWAVLGHLVAEQSTIATVIHPDATVSKSAKLAAGVFVGPQAVVHAEAVVGPGCVVNSGAVVEHHVNLGAAVHAGPGSVLTGRAWVGPRTLIGAGAVVLPGVSVDEDVVIGAGAVVTRDVAAGMTMVGNPARPIDSFTE